MAVMMPREKWTDERLDETFARLDADIRELRSDIKTLGAKAPQGSFTLAKANEGLPLLRVQSDRTCVYVPQFIETEVVNGTPTTMKMRAFWQLVEEFPEGACPGGLRQSSTFSLTSVLTGEPLYIAGQLTVS